MRPRFDARDVIQWSGGVLARGSADTSFTGASIDTRTISPGELFVAIRGPEHDAHEFLAQALERGAAGLIVEREPASASVAGDVPIVAVADGTRALGALAAGYRSRFRGPVVAITGSSGKTTTKEMCASILGAGAPCLKTEGNLNNEFGLPLTLLKLLPEHRSATVELGMNHRGEIARLAAIARPSVALITNIGTAHIEFLGSREEIAQEKGDLFAALDENAVAVVNLDDPLVVEQSARARGLSLGYGRQPEAALHAEDVRLAEGGAFTFELVAPAGRVSVRVAGLGESTVINALAAAAAALEAGASLENVATGLEGFRPVGGRMAPVSLEGDVTLIDDTYNANPQSMRAALEALAALKGRGRAVAVLGDMAELGGNTSEAHRASGRLAAKLGIDFLFALGEQAESVATGAAEAGMDPERVHVEVDPGSASRNIREILKPHDWILIKGSRAMRMERIVQALAKEEKS